MKKEAVVYWTDVSAPQGEKKAVNICFNNQMGKEKLGVACSVCVCPRWSVLPAGRTPFLCKSSNDLVYPSDVMIIYWAERCS